MEPRDKNNSVVAPRPIPSPTTYFTEFVLQIVFSFLTLRELTTASLASHQWNTIANGTPLWEYLLERYFGLAFFLPAHQYLPICVVWALESQQDVQDYMEQHRLQPHVTSRWDPKSGQLLPPACAIRKSKYPLANFSAVSLELLTQSACACASVQQQHQREANEKGEIDEEERLLLHQRQSLVVRHQNYHAARRAIARTLHIPSDEPLSLVKLFVGRSAKDLFVMLRTHHFVELPFHELGYMEKAGVVFGSIAFSPFLFIYFLPEVVRWSVAPIVETADEVEEFVAQYLASSPGPVTSAQSQDGSVSWWATIRRWYGRVLSVPAAPYVMYRVGPKRSAKMLWKASAPIRELVRACIRQIARVLRRIWKLTTFLVKQIDRAARALGRTLKQWALFLWEKSVLVAKFTWHHCVRLAKAIKRQILLTRDVIYVVVTITVVHPCKRAARWCHKHLVSPGVNTWNHTCTSVMNAVETYILIPLRRKPSLADRLEAHWAHFRDQRLVPCVHVASFYMREFVVQFVVPVTTYVLKQAWRAIRWSAHKLDEIILGPCADCMNCVVEDVILVAVRALVRLIVFLCRDLLVPTVKFVFRCVRAALTQMWRVAVQVGSFFYWNILRPAAIVCGKVFIAVKEAVRVTCVFLYVHVALNIWRAANQTGKWFYWNLLRPIATGVGVVFRAIKSGILRIGQAITGAARWMAVSVIMPAVTLVVQYWNAVRSFFWRTIMFPIAQFLRWFIEMICRTAMHTKTVAVRTLQRGYQLMIAPVGRVRRYGTHVMFVSVPHMARQTMTSMWRTWGWLQKRFVKKQTATSQGLKSSSYVGDQKH